MAFSNSGAIATGAVTTRADAASGTTNGSAVVTDAAAIAADVGKPVSGTGIPAGSFIISVAVGVSFTMSQPATATGSVTVTVGFAPADAGAGKTYRQFSLKVASSAPDAVVALETSPDMSAWTEQCRISAAQGWAYAASSHTRRGVRANVISLGTGAPRVSANIGYY